MSKKIKVIFEGGNATDGVHSCDYMLCNCYDRDGEPVRLYAEYLQPEDLAFGDLDGFDKEDDHNPLWSGRRQDLLCIGKDLQSH